ncbi:unnamed protein product [Ophioblennius macclurei]
MFFVDLFLFVSALMTVARLHVTACNYSCSDPPFFSPSTLVVKHGDSASAKCVVCKDACINRLTGLEVAFGDKNSSADKRTWTWSVDNMAHWSQPVLCFYESESGMQCCSALPVTVYQPPESVSISIMNHTGPMLEHKEYTLQCTVHNVAPVENLVVTFYRGLTALGEVRSKSTTKTPVTEMFTLNINNTREDDGAKLWCQAELDLGPYGPKPLPNKPSEKILSTVYYGPELEGPANPDDISITEGSILQMNCSAVGNPQPSYTWMWPSNSSAIHNGSILTITSVELEHKGHYVCIVTSDTNKVIVNFKVDVRVNIIPYVIAAVVVLLVLLLLGVLVACIQSYKQKRMGQYNLKDVFRLHVKHTAVPIEG